MKRYTDIMGGSFKTMCSILLTAGVPYVMWIKDIATPLVVFAAAVIGLCGAVIGFLNHWNKYKKNKRENGK